MSRLLDLSLEGIVLPSRSKRATDNAPAKIIAQFEIEIDEISDEEAGALARCVGSAVTLSVTGVPPVVKKRSEPRPMDVALANAQSSEHSRPGPFEHCRACSRVIGDDRDSGWHTPTEGQPSPLCGTCLLEEDDLELVKQRREEERAQFIAALNSTERTSELHIALTDAYDSNDAERQDAARGIVGIEPIQQEYALPEDPDAYATFVAWLREGYPDEAVCPQCEGSGVHETGIDTSITCPTCGGTGYAIASSDATAAPDEDVDAATGSADDDLPGDAEQVRAAGVDLGLGPEEDYPHAPALDDVTISHDETGKPVATARRRSGGRVPVS